MRVPLIDLFAGPGGLSHGFAAYRGAVRFTTKLSIEKDEVAQSTLCLRAFLKHFTKPPNEYLKYVRGEAARELIESTYPSEWTAAKEEVRCWTLGQESFSDVSAAISKALDGARQWVLLGGPPCQAYSLVGRSRMKNDEDFKTDERHTLYKEYLKIVAVHQPPVFVMENVKGILSSTHGARKANRSIFLQIMEDLREPAKATRDDHDVISCKPRLAYGYSIHSFVTRALIPEALQPEDFVIKSEDWGIPQRRHRVILLGIRDDIAAQPRTLADYFSKDTVCIEEVLECLPKLRSRVSKGEDSPETWRRAIEDISLSHFLSKAVAPEVRKEIEACLTKLRPYRSVGARFVEGRFKPAKLSKWLSDATLGGVVQHESRSHMESDLRRYFFAACAARVAGSSPKLRVYPPGLLPEHKNVTKELVDAANGEDEKIDFEDRFRVQVKGHPSTTVTSHISKDGHYYIHYDPTQCRSLTVREAARLQTFPDSYFFEGNRTQQYHQVGNAVPPLLASKLAAVVADVLSRSSIPKANLRRTSCEASRGCFRTEQGG
jgi:DNA (cytosine-5)-methyltransferase 1